MDNMQTRIKLLRRRTGMTQAQVGAVLGIGQKPVSMIEHGINQPTVRQIVALCRLYGVSADYLIFGIDDKTLSPDELDVIQVLRTDKTISEAVHNIAHAHNNLMGLMV